MTPNADYGARHECRVFVMPEDPNAPRRWECIVCHESSRWHYPDDVSPNDGSGAP